MDKDSEQKPRYQNEVPQHDQKVQIPSSVSQHVALAETVRASTLKAERDQVGRDIDKEYLVRALSHDIGAHLMILEYSFRHYDEQAKKLVAESQALTVRDISPENPSVLNINILTEATSHVTACINEMKRFVNELVSFAKTGNIDMDPSAIKIAELVDEVLFEQQHLIEKRKINVVVSAPLPTVFANPVRIKQVLTNLIRNAAIHGCDEMMPMIMIASEFVPNTELVRDAMACFSIRDNGRGIPQKEREKIFEPGYRVPGNQNEGSGIGLATVKKIARYYGGDVICESHDGGTLFTVALPKG